MTLFRFLLLIVALAVLPAATSFSNLKPFAVVELFTSEGCSSCPPADTILRDLVREADENNLNIYPLSFHVDYWNSLGWRDPFSKSTFTARQWEYAKQFGQAGVYTPEMVVNGQNGFGGYDRRLLDQYLRDALKISPSISVHIYFNGRSHSMINVSFKIEGIINVSDHVLNVALVERDLQVDVTAGENKGAHLIHDNVVRKFQSVKLNNAVGEVQMSLPNDFHPQKSALIAYIQSNGTKKTLAATRLDFPK